MGLTVLILLVLEGGAGRFWGKERKAEKQHLELVNRVRYLTEENKKAVIIRRVSEQLEEIAYQQKEISDEQRREALRQRGEAERMRQQAETEKERALEARSAALNAYRVAEEQKKIAELRREEALEAQRKADTLAGLALGRSLGSLADGHYFSGERELARLLGYYAWKYTTEYAGDCYQPAVFGALSLVSGFPVSYSGHQGPVRDVKGFWGKDGNYRVVSVGQGGEIRVWEGREGREISRELYADPLSDFRRVETDGDENFYALAYSGEIVAVKEGEVAGARKWETGKVGGGGLWYDGRRLIFLASDGEVMFFSREGNFLGNVSVLKKVTAVYAKGKDLFAGDREGNVIRIDTSGWKCDTLFREWNVPVTALGTDAGGKWLAIGYKDGSVVVKERGASEKYRRFSGHISEVTSLVFSEAGLLSTAYDGRLNLWRLGSDKPDPVALAVSANWLLCAWVLPDKQEVICGENSGTLSRICFSPERMAGNVKDSLTRDLTEAERAYYLNGRRGGLK